MNSEPYHMLVMVPDGYFWNEFDYVGSNLFSRQDPHSVVSMMSQSEPVSKDTNISCLKPPWPTHTDPVYTWFK